MNTIGKFTKVLCGLILLQSLVRDLKAEEVAQEQILFLHLQITNGAVRLVESTTVSGHFKPAVTSQKPGDLYLELISTNDRPVWNGVVPDPLVHRYEYEDPDHPRQLKVKEVKLDHAEFMVRIPGRTEARKLDVYRFDPPAARSTESASIQARTLLGTIELRVPEAAR